MEKDREIEKLNDMCDKFDIKRVKDKITTSVTKTLDEIEIEKSSSGNKEQEIQDFLGKLINEHERALQIEQ